MMSFPALSVNISPASFLKYTTYSSNTVVSPMTTKIIGGAVISEHIADTIHSTADCVDLANSKWKVLCTW